MCEARWSVLLAWLMMVAQAGHGGEGQAESAAGQSVEALSGSVGAISFSRGSGYCEAPFELVIAAPREGCAIYYTTNGSMPAAATGLRYSEAVRIAGTTILRAAAFGRGTRVSGVGTRTYVFLEQVVEQTGAGCPNTWGTNQIGLPPGGKQADFGTNGVPAYYGMSAAVRQDGDLRMKLVEGLRSLPAVSIVSDPEDLFSPEKGIYSHPTERGAAWERGANVEFFGDSSVPGLQVDCGIRIHGGTSRRPSQSPKHSFRLLFKGGYGSAKLRGSLFGADGPRELDALVLRAGNNDSWLDSDADQRLAATYLRDEWMRRSMEVMGYTSARGRFVHLYLNGLYWGLYNLCERPGPDLFERGQRAGVGVGAKFDYRKGDEVESGDNNAWNRMMALANSGVSEGPRYEKMGELLDLREFADFLILNFYAGNTDWDRSANWLAVRPRGAAGRFRFFAWDAECILGKAECELLELDDDESPLRLFQKLAENETFRAMFASRARELLYGEGPLAPAKSAKRFADLAGLVAGAVEAESARWGSYRRDVHPFKSGPYESYTVAKHWRPEVQRIVERYFDTRRKVLVEQFQRRGLFEPKE